MCRPRGNRPIQLIYCIGISSIVRSLLCTYTAVCKRFERQRGIHSNEAAAYCILMFQAKSSIDNFIPFTKELPMCIFCGSILDEVFVKNTVIHVTIEIRVASEIWNNQLSCSDEFLLILSVQHWHFLTFESIAFHTFAPKRKEMSSELTKIDEVDKCNYEHFKYKNDPPKNIQCKNT